MRSIIDEIATAEQQADEIRRQAVAQAKESLNLAQLDAEKALSDTDASERDVTREALLAAERDGELAAGEILAHMEQDADTLCKQARVRIDDAVTYLVKRVMEAS